MAAAIVVPVALVGVVGLALYKMGSSPPPKLPEWQLVSIQPSLEPVHSPPTSDAHAGNDRPGAHHLAAFFGPGCMYFTPEVTQLLARL